MEVQSDLMPLLSDGSGTFRGRHTLLFRMPCPGVSRGSGNRFSVQKRAKRRMGPCSFQDQVVYQYFSREAVMLATSMTGLKGLP